MNRREKEKKLKFRDTEYTENDIFENEEDRQRVLSMNELERETEISERVQKLNQKREREFLLKQKSEINNTNIRKKDALQEIKKKRYQKQRMDREGLKKDDNDNLSSFSSDSESGEINDSASSNSDDSSDDDYSDDDSIKKRNKKREQKTKGKRSRSSSSSSCLSVISVGSDDKSNKKDTFNLSLTDIEKIRLTRTFADRNWESPIFDLNVKGCFVKINISSKNVSSGTTYILAQIKDVIENKDKPYLLGNKQCTKYLFVTHGNQEKQITICILSNAGITEIEFRIWKDRMDKYNLEIPTLEKIKVYSENIEKIKNYQLSNEEFRQMMDKKKDLKIKHLDKNMNITYELSLLSDEYHSAKQKYEENKDRRYIDRMQELVPKIENLKKMAQEREKEESKRSGADRIEQINKKNSELQKLSDLRNSLINKKKKRDEVVNPYKRRDCKPINLYDSGYLKKNESKKENEEMQIMKENEEKNQIDTLYSDITPQKLYEIRKRNLAKVEDAFKKLSNELDDLYHKKKQKKMNTDKDSSSDNFIFQILGVNKNKFIDIVNTHNSKLSLDNIKVITLKDLDY